MILSTPYIDAYKKQDPFTKEMDEIFKRTNGKREIEANRQEVCIALCEILSQYEVAFPLWNKELISNLIDNDLGLCNDIVLLPIVGAQAKFDCELLELHGSLTLVIDLLNIADYTKILKEMEYILHNQIHKKIVAYVLQKRYPQPTQYQAQLLHRCFVQGGSQLLAWRDGLDLLFTQPQYQEKYARCKSLLEKALQIESKPVQSQILNTLETCDLWDDFATCYGMFTFAQKYQEEKEKGLYEMFLQGPDSIYSSLQ